MGKEVMYMRHTQNNENPLEDLTATEISHMWAAYLKSSMELRFFEYFSVTVTDNIIKNLVDRIRIQAEKNLREIKDILTIEKLTIPLGFTEEDVRTGAPALFSDTFILYFCFDITQLSMSTYSSALSDSTRKDIRNFIQLNMDFYMEIQNEIVNIMLDKSVYLKPPQVTMDNQLEFVDNITYLSGLFDGSRSVNAAEIANLSRVIHRAQFSKMIFVTFRKIATKKNVKKHFGKGRDVLENTLDSLEEVLEKENIPISASGDYKIYDVEMSPFSDKLMLFFVNTCLGVFCFTMVSQGMTSSLRSDIVYKFTKISDEMKKYYGQGLLLAIKEKWIEEPPQAVDRKV